MTQVEQSSVSSGLVLLFCATDFRCDAGRVPPLAGSDDPAADVVTSLSLKCIFMKVTSLRNTWQNTQNASFNQPPPRVETRWFEIQSFIKFLRRAGECQSFGASGFHIPSPTSCCTRLSASATSPFLSASSSHSAREEGRPERAPPPP